MVTAALESTLPGSAPRFVEYTNHYAFYQIFLPFQAPRNFHRHMGDPPPKISVRR
jgi:hypothetical protein